MLETIRRVQLPSRMKGLRRDERGYPIPFIVYYDDAGKPWFTINDEEKVSHCLRHELCATCGQKLTRGKWLVGGALSAFHPDGAFFDTAMHHECAAYALQVCPWLAMPSYAKAMGTKRMPEEKERVFVDTTVIQGKPPMFVAVMTSRIELSYKGIARHLTPLRPYMRVEFWRDGAVIPQAEGFAIAAQLIAEFDTQLLEKVS